MRPALAPHPQVPQPARKDAGYASRQADPEPRLQRSIGNQAVLRLLDNQADGHVLPGDVRGRFEPRFGQNLGEVRVHRDGPAARSARSMGALAYTVGNHIVFAEGQYQPGTLVGDRILAHEIAHVLQQQRATLPSDGTHVPLAASSNRHEAEAHRASRAVALGHSAAVASDAPLHVARLDDPAKAPERSWANTMADRFLAEQLRRLDDSQAQFSQSLRNLAAALPPAQFAQADAAIGVVDAIIDTFQSIGMFLMGIQAGTVELLIDMIVGLAKLALFVIELLGRLLSDLIAWLLQQAGVKIHLPGESGGEFGLKALAALEKLPASIRASFEAWQARYKAAPPELKAGMLGRLLPEVVATLLAGVGAARAAVAGGRALLSTSPGRALTVSLQLSLARVQAEMLTSPGMSRAGSLASAPGLVVPASTVPAAVATPLAAAAPLAAAEASAVAAPMAAAAPLAVAEASAVAAPVAGAAGLTGPQRMSLAYAASLAPTHMNVTAGVIATSTAETLPLDTSNQWPANQPAMTFGTVPEEALLTETSSSTTQSTRTPFDVRNEQTPETLEAQSQRNVPQNERAVGSPGTARHGESESRSGTSLRLYDAAEVDLRLRSDYSPEYGGYLRWVEFDVPTTSGNFGTRPSSFSQADSLTQIGVQHPTHEDLTHTNSERGHAVAQENSGGDPDIARALMVTTNTWPMTGRGRAGLNQGAYRDFERAYTALKADNPGSVVRIRIEAVVGSQPRFVQGPHGNPVLSPQAFTITVTYTPASGGSPMVVTFTLPN